MIEITHIAETSKTLIALQEDWMLVDDFPDKDFLVLVNMDREVMEDFYPKKDLILNMKKQGLIKNYEDSYDHQPATYSYFVTHSDGRIEEVIRHNPHVYYYKLTKKGKDFLSNQRIT